MTLTSAVSRQSGIETNRGQVANLKCSDDVRTKCDQRALQAARHIECNLNNSELRVLKLARLVHLSPARLRQLMNRDFGCGPKEYMLMLRMNRAEHLLRTSQLTVKEVMVAVGYSDPSHFSRDYKECFSLSPQLYRQTTCNTTEMGTLADYRNSQVNSPFGHKVSSRTFVTPSNLRSARKGVDAYVAAGSEW